jgi:hypothetical protein
MKRWDWRSASVNKWIGLQRSCSKASAAESKTQLKRSGVIITWDNTEFFGIVSA